MIRKLAATFLQDLLLTFRSGHIYVIMGLASLILVLVFTLPSELDSAPPEVIYDASPEGQFGAFLLAQGLESDALFHSEATFETALSEYQRAIGLIFRGNLQNPRIEIISQGNVAEENIYLMQATLALILRTMRGEATDLPAEITHLGPKSDPIPLNKNMIPVFLTFEVILLGFLIGAVLIFQSKQEGTLHAYRVTPAGTLHFILSKVILYGALSLAYGLVIVLIVFGLTPNYLALTALILLSSALMTCLGLTIAVFFNNISEWFFAGVLLLIVSMLPTISYAMPVFSPALIAWIPTYQIIFGFRNILFAQGGPSGISSMLLQVFLSALIAFGICIWAVNKKLMQEGG